MLHMQLWRSSITIKLNPKTESNATNSREYTKKQWYNYCFQTDMSPDAFSEILHFMEQRKSYSYLLYTHFADDRATDDESCSENHYHLLVSGNFTTRAGNIVKASQTYVYEWVNKFMTRKKDQKHHAKLSSTQKITSIISKHGHAD